VAPVKLNFKEMMTRSAGGTSAVVAAVPVPVPVAAVAVAVPVSKTSGIVSNVVPQKSLSSSNIFLAAFQPTMAHADDAEADDYIESKPVLASSVLIDSCDKKYDRLYR
jgi:hypothetical protein